LPTVKLGLELDAPAGLSGGKGTPSTLTRLDGLHTSSKSVHSYSKSTLGNRSIYFEQLCTDWDQVIFVGVMRAQLELVLKLGVPAGWRVCMTHQVH
jgi:hypothetical protein